MRTHRLLPAAFAALVLLCSSVALAQPGAPPPPPPQGGDPGGQGFYGGDPYQLPGGFWDRRSLALGFGFGIGGMSSDDGPIECFDCDYNPASLGAEFHIGGMLNPRLALLFEIWGTGQTLDRRGTEVLSQTMLMGALQYFVTPRLWIKGGLGVAALTLSVDDGYEYYDEAIDEGGAIMGAIGYEVLSARHFAIDLQLRLGSGSYDGIGERIHSGAFGVGFNWY